MRPRDLFPALCLVILPSSIPGAAHAEPPEAALYRRADPGAADERRLELAQETFYASPLRPVYWPAVLSLGVATGGIMVGLSATLSAGRQLDAADQVLRKAAATTPSDRMVCPLGTESRSCAEVSARLADVRRLEDLAIAGYAVGGMAAAIGVALAVWPIRVRGRSHTAAMAPVTSPQGGGLLVVGTF